MSELNHDIPAFEALLRREFLYDHRPEHVGFVPAYVFGAATLPGRCLCFHVLLEDGAQIGRVPIHAIVTLKCPPRPLDDLELWDCPSVSASCHTYASLAQRVEAVLKTGERAEGDYLFTVDYWGTAIAESAGDMGWKCHHVVALDSGHLVALPNNRLAWLEGAMVTKPWTRQENPPPYQTIRDTWHSENGSKWRTEDSERMFYRGEDVEDERLCVSCKQPARAGRLLCKRCLDVGQAAEAVVPAEPSKTHQGVVKDGELLNGRCESCGGEKPAVGRLCSQCLEGQP